MIAFNKSQESLVHRVIGAIKVLDERTQETIINRIQNEGGITDRHRIVIADLLDARVLEEGGTAALQAERQENDRVISALGNNVQFLRGKKAQEDRTEQDAFEQRAGREQERVLGEYDQGINATARRIDTRAEGLIKNTKDADTMRNLYNILNNEKPEDRRN